MKQHVITQASTFNSLGAAVITMSIKRKITNVHENTARSKAETNVEHHREHCDENKDKYHIDFSYSIAAGA